MYVDLICHDTKIRKENFKQRCSCALKSLANRTDVVRVLKCHKYYLTNIVPVTYKQMKMTINTTINAYK